MNTENLWQSKQKYTFISQKISGTKISYVTVLYAKNRKQEDELLLRGMGREFFSKISTVKVRMYTQTYITNKKDN